MCLRCQLTGAQSPVKVIEVFPPAVQSRSILVSPIPRGQRIIDVLIAWLAELHDYIGAERGRQMGIPLNEFTDQAWAGLSSGNDEVFVGFLPPKERFFSIAGQRRAACEGLSQRMKQMH